MLYRLFTPTPALAGMIDCYWYSAIAANSRSVQQYNTPLFESLVFNFDQLKEFHQYDGKTTCLTKPVYIFGQTQSRTIISGHHEKGGYIIGVRFKPLGLAKITGINMIHLAGKVVDAEDVWGNQLEWLCEAMQEAKTTEAAILVLERFLIARRRTIHLKDRVKDVDQAISLMQAHKGNITSKELQYLTNTGRKTLERAFMNFHGLQPKIYNRIIRFNIARKMIDDDLRSDFTALRLIPGYFDPSHFIKEFKKFSGQTPTEYLKTIEEERRKRTIPVD